MTGVLRAPAFPVCSRVAYTEAAASAVFSAVLALSIPPADLMNCAAAMIVSTVTAASLGAQNAPSNAT